MGKKHGIIFVAFSLLLVFLFSGCSNKTQTPPQEQVYSKVMEKNILPEMVLLDQESGLDYLGIDSQLCEEQILALCKDSLKADELLLIKAKDSDSADSLEKALQARMDAKATEARTYSPEQYVIIQQGRILRNGVYLALLVSPQIDELEKAYHDAMK